MRRFSNIELEISPTGLQMPASYSRNERRVASLQELLTSRFVPAALDLGLLIQRPQENLPTVGELTPDEMREVTLASMRSLTDNEQLVSGSDVYSPNQLRDEVRTGTHYGDELAAGHRRLIYMMESAATNGKLKLVPDPEPDAPIEFPEFPY